MNGYVLTDADGRLTAASDKYHCGEGETTVVFPSGFSLDGMRGWRLAEGRLVREGDAGGGDADAGGAGGGLPEGGLPEGGLPEGGLPIGARDADGAWEVPEDAPLHGAELDARLDALSEGLDALETRLTALRTGLSTLCDALTNAPEELPSLLELLRGGVGPQE